MPRFSTLHRISLSLLMVALAAGSDARGANAPLSTSSATTQLAELQARIRELISQPRFRSSLWGIQVVAAQGGSVLFETNALSYFVPGSNTKLFTAALALDQLGTEYRIPTSFYARTKPDSRGTLKGDLLIYGRGDPSVGLGSNGTTLASWVTALTNAGVRSIQGDLIADESFFIGSRFGSGWAIDDLPFTYSPEVSALSYNQNIVDLIVSPGQAAGLPALLRFVPDLAPFEVTRRLLTVPSTGTNSVRWDRPAGTRELVVWGGLRSDSPAITNALTVPRPALWVANSLGRALQAAGVRWKGKTRSLNWLDRIEDPFDPTRWTELANVPSPRLADLVRSTLKPSNNLAAQLLYLQVGANEPPLSGRLTEEASARAMSRFLGPILQGKPEAILEEGSGLSRRHLLSPASVVALLSYMQHHPAADVFRESLPIAGVDGTLRTRFRGTPAAGKILAKTGTLRGVSSLSGYMTTAGNEPLIFSILLNSYLPKAGEPSPRDEVDAIAVLLASFPGTSGAK